MGNSAGLPDPFVGKYECHLYDAGGKNDWHYVEITSNGDGAYKWTTRAGPSWTLTPGKDPSKLALKEDCPYFKEVKVVEVRRNGSGAVTALVFQGEPVRHSSLSGGYMCVHACVRVCVCVCVFISAVRFGCCCCCFARVLMLVMQ